MDKLDRNILEKLQQQGRITNQELAESVGLSAAACLRRVQRLEDSGLIDRYAAILNARKLGLEMMVMAEVSLAQHSSTLLQQFEDAAQVHPEILECHLMSGEADYLLKVLARNTEDYERIYRSILTALPGVTRIRSSFAIRSIIQRTALPLPAGG